MQSLLGVISRHKQRLLELCVDSDENYQGKLALDDLTGVFTKWNGLMHLPLLDWSILLPDLLLSTASIKHRTVSSTTLIDYRVIFGSGLKKALQQGHVELMKIRAELDL